ncbi:hypothetical protein DUNSADRAFT_373, partial [Dunaliella salina]
MRSYAPDDEDDGTVQEPASQSKGFEGKQRGSTNSTDLEKLSWVKDNKRLDVKRGTFSTHEKDTLWEAVVEFEADNNTSREELVDAFSDYGSRRCTKLRMAVVKAAQRRLPHRTKYALCSFIMCVCVCVCG